MEGGLAEGQGFKESGWGGGQSGIPEKHTCIKELRATHRVHGSFVACGLCRRVGVGWGSREGAGRLWRWEGAVCFVAWGIDVGGS